MHTSDLVKGGTYLSQNQCIVHGHSPISCFSALKVLPLSWCLCPLTSGDRTWTLSLQEASPLPIILCCSEEELLDTETLGIRLVFGMKDTSVQLSCLRRKMNKVNVTPPSLWAHPARTSPVMVVTPDRRALNSPESGSG